MRFINLGVAALLLAVTIPFSTAAHSEEQLVARKTFTDYTTGSVGDWIREKGFRASQDAQRRNIIDLDVDDRGLVIEAKQKAFGILTNESVDISTFNVVEIDWGVIKHPTGASYEQGIRNEALSVMVFMGDERKPSGSIFIPDAPYFVGLFLCSGDDRVRHPYVGKYFQKSGRYVCLEQPTLGEIVTSRFDLLKAYKTFFDKEGDDDPGISGIALAMDTKKASDDGTASAFIREIRFYR